MIFLILRVLTIVISILVGIGLLIKGIDPDVFKGLYKDLPELKSLLEPIVLPINVSIKLMGAGFVAYGISAILNLIKEKMSTSGKSVSSISISSSVTAVVGALLLIASFCNTLQPMEEFKPHLKQFLAGLNIKLDDSVEKNTQSGELSQQDENFKTQGAHQIIDDDFIDEDLNSGPGEEAAGDDSDIPMDLDGF